MDYFLDKFFRWARFKKVIREIPKNSVVCDIGCGRNFYFLEKISDFIKYGVGADKEVKSCQAGNIELKRVDISKNIPLENGNFDAVTMIASLEHLEYPQEVLNESFRILKKGGKLILTTPTPLAKPILEFLAFKLRLIDNKEIEGHKNYFYPKIVKKMLIRAGFKEKNIKSRFFDIFLNSLTTAEK
jgi:ubiquinone/menaquinone biosynthesis C-methylase UbiE